ncbi:hypothetical protein U9M48_005570, partial [Paspalum notatum var. saurae]
MDAPKPDDLLSTPSHTLRRRKKHPDPAMAAGHGAGEDSTSEPARGEGEAHRRLTGLEINEMPAERRYSIPAILKELSENEDDGSKLAMMRILLETYK